MKCAVCSKLFTESSPVFLLKNGDQEVLTCSVECLVACMKAKPQRNFLDFRKPYG